MEQTNQNFVLSSILGANKPTKLDKTPKYIQYCDTRKGNIVSGAMPPYNSKSFDNYTIYSCSNLTVDPKENLETPENMFKFDKNSERSEKSLKLKNEVTKYKKELTEFTNNTKDLEERYTVINSELNDMKEKYKCFIRNMHCGDCDNFSEDSSAGNEYTLRQKCTPLFHRNNSFIQILSDEPLKKLNYKLPNSNGQNISIADNHKIETVDQQVSYEYHSENKENMPSHYASSSSSFDKSSENESDNEDKSKSLRRADVSSLKKTITKLQNESNRFSLIIEQQKNTLSDYRLHFSKAQHLVKEQRIEIEQLNSKNQELEKDVSSIIDELHHKIDTKLKDVNLLSDRMRADQVKRDFVIKENCMLHERIKVTEAEAKQLKIKLEEMNSRKMAILSRLKVAERDLKIFKNYNTVLKQEKRKLNEEMKTLNDQIDNMQDVNKRSMSRHREQNEKQRRQMQKRIFDLEMKLSRSQNSTTSLIQQRDTLIAELQSQLNNLVHNFEVSQKHIRVLRRHIYSMCENSNRQSIIRNRSLG